MTNIFINMIIILGRSENYITTTILLNSLYLFKPTNILILDFFSLSYFHLNKMQLTLEHLKGVL